MKTLDFETDIKAEIQRFCDHWEFKISLTQSFDKILLDYLTVRFKIIEPKRRVVHISPQLQDELKRHPKKDEIIGIIHNAGVGNNLNPFLSKRLLQANFHDHLQTEWNIFHFHLSLDKPANSYFVKQVNALLFAYITSEEIIFLGTDTHREGIFGDSKWPEVLHDHFPDKIARYKDSVIKEIYPAVSAAERQTLWNKGYTLGMTKIRDTVYHSPGIGRATSGHAFGVTNTSNEILRWIHKIKEQLLVFENEICDYLNILPDVAEFKVVFGNVTLELVEVVSGKKLLKFPEVFNVAN